MISQVQVQAVVAAAVLLWGSAYVESFLQPITSTGTVRTRTAIITNGHQLPDNELQTAEGPSTSATEASLSTISGGAVTADELAWQTNNAFTTASDDTSPAAAAAAKWIKQDIESQSTAPFPLADQDQNSQLLLTNGPIRGPTNVLVYDTTLRDGTQMESISVSCADKLKISQRLSAFNVDYIEAGWPGSNPKDEEFFNRAKTQLDSKTKSKLVAFGSTRRKGIQAKDDVQIQKLVECGAPTVCIVAKAHLWQVTDIIRADPTENLDMISDSVSHLTSLGIDVMVDLEHFFDGFKFDKEYTLQCCEAAVKAGAKVLVMCDTNGGSMPWEVDEITKETVDKFGNLATIGIHCHNDCGLAVANSLTGAKAGVGLIQGTINGIGERTGNADLCSIVPSLALHVDSNMTCNDNLNEITSLSRYLDETLNRTPDRAAPYVGASAFAHKGGLHVAALERSPDSYQHVDPAKVGNKLRVLISELSGRQNILGKIKKLDIDIDESVVADRALVILERVKQLESLGYTFEGADASVELMILHSTQKYCIPFRVLDYTAQVYDTDVDSASRVMSKMENDKSNNGGAVIKTNLARATVNVRVLDDPNLGEDEFLDRLEVAEGNGPVDALANALKKALVPSHPSLESLQLIDYKVRILDPAAATAAATRVMIEFKDVNTDRQWTTVSVDRNIISASLNALVDGFEYALKDVVAGCFIDDFE
jgi:2-isopropylmalate synthase